MLHFLRARWTRGLYGACWHAGHVSGGSAPYVYAVDVSPWPRCDAEASPDRSYLYHPSRHSAGRPIVAGWAYQLVAGLSFERDSWVAPVDARRVRPEEDATEVAAEQVRGLGARLQRQPEASLFVFDAGYDPGARLPLLNRPSTPSGLSRCRRGARDRRSVPGS